MVFTFILSFFAIIALFVLIFAYMYNNLVTKKNHCDEGWSGIDISLKRRYDLIPNLVNVVKGYAAHEQSTFEKVVAQRNACQQSGSVKERAENENILSGMLKSIFALSEAYPELKANTNFIELQKSLSEIEENISMARRYYNATARDMNILVESFPSNLVANAFGFKTRTFYEIENAVERQNVQVNF